MRSITRFPHLPEGAAIRSVDTMSAMAVDFLRKLLCARGLCACGAAACLALAAPGCVREVLQGDDPDSHAGRLTGQNNRDTLTIRIPWMALPVPQLVRDGTTTQAETVFGRVPGGKTRYTLREPSGTSAQVDARSKAREDGSIEFTYEVVSLPPGLSLQVPFQLAGLDGRPDITVTVNGAPMNAAPDDRSALILLARDGATRVVAIPKPAPASAPTTPKTP